MPPPEPCKRHNSFPFVLTLFCLLFLILVWCRDSLFSFIWFTDIKPGLSDDGIFRELFVSVIPGY